MNIQETYMYRCLQIAKMGAGKVAPNPMVGAVLVYEDNIIGEGYHENYGEAHAEVNCINSVSESNIKFINKSTLYVSLEPCAHFGKTPPCADLIIKHKIPNVVIGCRDSYNEVDGKGIQKLQSAGVDVTVGVLEKEAMELNRRFFIFHSKKRPFIILKWAQSDDAKIAAIDYAAVKISSEFTSRLVHKWRSEEAAILVGFNTALQDDPTLNNRFYTGNDPVRLVLDRHLKLPADLHIFDGKIKTIVFNELEDTEIDGIIYKQLPAQKNLLPSLLEALYHLNIQSIFVEGGAKLLQSFIDQHYWDEARIITNKNLLIGDGIIAPRLSNQQQIKSKNISTDLISIYQNKLHQ